MGRDADPDADPVAVAREIALRRLTARARTRRELAGDLARRQVPDEVAESVLDRFQEVGLVDDVGFARAWVSSHTGISARRMRDQLRSKGVSDDDIEGAVSEISADDDLAGARELASKKLRSMRNLDELVRDRRLAGALARRGYGSGVVRQVLREVRQGTV